jgi:uncharacterized membrane-anchored protein
MKTDDSKKAKTLPPEIEFSEKVKFRDYLVTTEQQAKKPLPFWRLAVPLMIQTGLILAVPSRAVYTDVTGRTVILQTADVDSNDLVRNNSVNLNYNISRENTLRRLQGWQQLVRQNPGRNSRNNGNNRNRRLAEGTNFYVVLEEQQFRRQGTTPRAWRLVRLTTNLPNSLPADQVALKGTYENGSVNYGLENYYLSEEQRQRLSNNLSRTRGNRGIDDEPILVEAKVNPQGEAVPISIWVQQRNYRF